MKKSLRKILGTGLLVGSLAVNGCTEFGSALIQDSPVGAYWDAKEQVKQDVKNRNKERKVVLPHQQGVIFTQERFIELDNGIYYDTQENYSRAKTFEEDE